MPIQVLIFLYLVIFTYGILIGSFLNVCIYRIPKGESIVSVPSHCMSCGYKLYWYNLIPVFSFLLQKGRCRKCGTKLSVQYPIVEGLNGILYTLVFLANGWQWTSVLFCLLTSVLIVISIIDIRTFEIPPGLNWLIMLLGVIRLLFDYKNWMIYLLGMICVSGFLCLLYAATKGRGIGGGDIKLMAAAGLLLGFPNIILSFFIGCILGSVIHLFRMIQKGAGHVLALGPYLSVGIWISALFGEELIRLYLHWIGF